MKIVEAVVRLKFHRDVKDISVADVEEALFNFNSEDQLVAYREVVEDEL